MAYDRYTWVDGEVITAQKLNHIEEGIADGVNGYECIETVTELFNETVTVPSDGQSATLAYSQQITANPLMLTFDGVDYEIPPTDISGGSGQQLIYGEFRDFTNYPFYIMTSAASTVVFCKTGGTHSIIGKSVAKTINKSECFKAAVEDTLLQLGSPVYVARLDYNSQENRRKLYQHIKSIYNTYNAPPIYMWLDAGRVAPLSDNGTVLKFKFFDVMDTWFGVRTITLDADGNTTDTSDSYTLTRQS